MSAFRFEDAYRGTPPWDIGRHQPVFEELADAGEITGPVLDVGCGTGENALFLAARGYEVIGVDAVEQAVRAARMKAAERGATVEFEVHDALALDGLGRRFATVVDSGLFHVFGDGERPRFVRSLASVLKLGGRYYVLCFSDLEPGTQGPRRVTRAELLQVFDAPPFRVLSIEPAEMATNLGSDRKAWLGRIERVAGR